MCGCVGKGFRPSRRATLKLPRIRVSGSKKVTASPSPVKSTPEPEGVSISEEKKEGAS